MTKHRYRVAADIVWDIRDGVMTHQYPQWARDVHYDASEGMYNYTRAVQIAEAFIHLFAAEDPRFDPTRFLFQCGLGKPVAKRRTA